MSQYFAPQSNRLVRKTLWSLLALGILLGGGAFAYTRSDYAFGVGKQVDQPAPFPHNVHVGQLGLDCRYCHESVDRSPFAGMPGAGVCMDCHARVWTGLDVLEPVRASYETKIPLAWLRIHDLPDFSRFDHGIHVNKGIGCVTCHGRIDQMSEVRKTETLSMRWCLECHWEPKKYVQPLETVYDLAWQMPRDEAGFRALSEQLDIRPAVVDGEELQDILALRYGLHQRTSCSTCHQ